jgi:hypothetical protein
MAKTDKATTELSADSPNPKISYCARRYKTDQEFAERHKERVRANYKNMSEDKKAKLIAKKTAKYFDSPEIQERQRQTSREYYHKKKAAIEVERSRVS